MQSNFKNMNILYPPGKTINSPYLHVCRVIHPFDTLFLLHSAKESINTNRTRNFIVYFRRVSIQWMESLLKYRMVQNDQENSSDIDNQYPDYNRYK